MKALILAVLRFYASSIGKKVVVALSALGLLGFLVGHLAGNLLIFKGPEAINAYAAQLHALGPLLWVARIGLLVLVGVHVAATLQLAAANRAARPQEYMVSATLRATRSSRLMVASGLTILVFVIYHLLHFTVGNLHGFYDADGAYRLEDGRQNVYKMMVDGFRVWFNAGFYLLALALLASHLSHGVASLFQTLGLTTPRTRPVFQLAGWVFAAVICGGFASIPVAVLAGVLK
jgi:succinate dehydrogenase / fumarate reductase cytochrome b subunit